MKNLNYERSLFAVMAERRSVGRILMFLCFALMSITMIAQENPERGYIITNEQDTLFGAIDFRTNKINCKQCAFKADGSEEYKNYMPGDIIGYRFMHNGKFYISHSFEYEGTNHNMFAEFMIKGTMNVYRVAGLCSDYVYFFENEDNEIVSYRNREKDDPDDPSSITEARKLSAYLLKSQRAAKEIKVGYMPESTILDIAHIYHEDVCTSNEDCIKFEYDPKSEQSKLTYNVHAGWTHYFGLDCNYAKIYDVPSVGVSLELLGNRRKKNLLYQITLDYAYGKGHYLGKDFNTTTRADASSHVLCLRVGPQYRMGITPKAKFTVRGGASVLLSISKEEAYEDKFNEYKQKVESRLLHDETYFDPCFCALYVGVGLDYHIGHGDIIANIDAFSPHIALVKGAPSVSTTIGYRF